MSQTALIITVPEAEQLVTETRDKYDPASMFGVPAHISLLYPFMPPAKVDDLVLQKLESLFSNLVSFSYRLDSIQAFPETLYIAPEPTSEFVRMIQAIARAFPEYPPYGDEHESIVPHMTIAFRHRRKWRRIKEKLEPALETGAGFTALCDRITLIENSSGMWRDMHEFPLLRGWSPGVPVPG